MNWQKEIVDAYKEYLKEFKTLKMINYEPINFERFVHFYCMKQLVRWQNEN